MLHCNGCRDLAQALTWRALHRCMLESQGLIVRSIPFYEWNSMETVDQQKTYLSRLLASAYAFRYK